MAGGGFGARRRDTGDAFPAEAPYPAGVEHPWPGPAAPPAPPSRGLPAHLGQHDEHVERILELLGGLEHGRQALLDKLWAEIPAAIYERAWLISATEVDVSPQTTGLEKITSVVVGVPPMQTGTLTLGDFELAVGAGVTNMTDTAFLLNQSDARKLVVTGAGLISLALFGVQYPTRGVFAP